MRFTCAVCGRVRHRAPSRIRRAHRPTCGATCRAELPRQRTRRPKVKKGVVLVYVGKDHPLADREGYARRSRLVAAKHLHRPLTPDERVLHKSTDSTDDRWSNLVVVRYAHRGRAA